MIFGIAVDHTTGDVLIDIAIIVVVARLVGMAFRKLRQPPVVGEFLAGVLLGPSLLGAFPGNLPEHVFPVAARPSLHVLADIGVVLFMFIVGLEADLDLIKGRARLAVSVSLSSILLPFGLGIAAAVLLHGDYGTVAGKGVNFWPFALFIGASMSVTAFPVLARILTERGMHRTTLGSLSLACAAVDDVAAWSLLAVVVAVVEASGLLDLPRILVSAGLFAAFLLVVVRPLLAKLATRYADRPHLGAEALAFLLAGLLVCAWATDRIGIHAIFGAFLFGAIMPKKAAPALVQEAIERIESVTVLLLLPIFFIVTGLDVNVREIGLSGLGALAVVLVAAIAGKFTGAAVVARSQGVPTRRAMALGTLMNTRGLTELVILTIGLELGVLNGRLFTVLVVMALVTTMMTEPLLRLVYPDRLLQADLDDAERLASTGEATGYRVMVLPADPAEGRALVDLAADLAGPGGVVVPAHFLVRAAGPRLDAGLAADLAQMAAAVDWLSRLGEHRADVAVRPHAQFSQDPVTSALAEIERTSVDLLLLGRRPGAEDSALDALLGVGLCHVAVADITRTVDRTRPTRVQAAEGVDADTAFELAARAALARADGADGTTILLVVDDPRDDGRARRLVDRFGRLHLPGVQLRTESAAAAAIGPGDLVLVGLAREGGDRSVAELDARLGGCPGVLVAVRSGDDPRRVGLEGRLRRINRSAEPLRAHDHAEPREDAAPVEGTPGAAASVTSPASVAADPSGPLADPTESP